jgi:hypothetical protein
MTDQYRARGLIAAKSSRIEKLLRDLGGQGLGLKELRTSIAEKLSDGIQKQLKSLHFLRNQAAHDDNFQISEQSLREFSATADDLVFQLELMIDGLASLESASELSSREDSVHLAQSADVSQPSFSEGDREILRKRALAEAENRRLAIEMDHKSVKITKAGMSPEMKARIKEQAIKVGASFLVSLFKK